MKEQDRARFRANIQWFNQFFDGIRNIYACVAEQLPAEFFPSAASFNSQNFYFQQQKTTPTIPPYYAFLQEGNLFGLQIITILDASLIAREGFFVHEPSIIVILHNQAEKNSQVSELALNVIKNRKVELRKVDGIVFGQVKSKFEADFFAFQVPLDCFSDNDNPTQAVRRYIITPLLDNLRQRVGTKV